MKGERKTSWVAEGDDAPHLAIWSNPDAGIAEFFLVVPFDEGWTPMQLPPA
jgi:hypothetical protein